MNGWTIWTFVTHSKVSLWSVCYIQGEVVDNIQYIIMMAIDDLAALYRSFDKNLVDRW